MDEQLDICVETAQEAGLIKHGDLVVITAGMPLGMVGSTNLIKVRTVADICFLGQGASPGVAEGMVRIIHKHTDWENLPKDVIVVLQKTDRSMIENLRFVRGIITEASGLTSHAAIVGRELSIPVVCNVPDATFTLENGQVITIDGASGQVSFGRASV